MVSRKLTASEAREMAGDMRGWAMSAERRVPYEPQNESLEALLAKRELTTELLCDEAREFSEMESTHGEPDRPPIVVPPTVLVQRPPEAWGEGR